MLFYKNICGTIRTRFLDKKNSEKTRAHFNAQKERKAEKRYLTPFLFRKNPKNQFGKPDVFLKKYKTAIFIDSCFWHGCQKHFSLPATREKFWSKKIDRNKERDVEVTKHYRRIGWAVVRIWEHDIKKNILRTLEKTVAVLIKKSNNQK